MDRTSYTNLAKAWEFVEDHAFSRQSVELNAVRTRAEETGIAQGSAAQAELLRVLVHMIGASSVIAVGTGSVVETLQLVNGLENGGQLTASIPPPKALRSSVLCSITYPMRFRPRFVR